MLVALNDIKPMNTNIKGETSVAKINIDGFAFQALSGKNLYKNVIRAIVREISCNALDAHVMAGTEDKPFDVHIPTMMEPYFAVRDYGIGLDDDGVRNVYLTYFGSTKRESNTQIGAWGLGSKSPLGYTDNFTVTAVKDGVERIYSVFKNQDGIPSISIICENPTDKHNGLEIRLPVVNDSDIELFKREALEVLQWFEVKPNFNVDMDFVKADLLIEGLGGNINVGKRNAISSVVVHGNIAYNLDSDMLKLRWGSSIDRLVKHGIQLFMPHGTIEYSMSREELSYTDSTIANIEASLTESVKGIVPKLAAMFDGVNQFDAYIKMDSLKRLSFITNEQENELVATGVSPLHLMEHSHFDVTNDCRKMGVKLYYKNGGRRGGVNIKVGEMEYIYPTNVTNMIFMHNEERSAAALEKKLKHNISSINGKVIVIPTESVNDFVQMFQDKIGYTINVVSSVTLDDVPKIKKAAKDASDEIEFRRLIEKSTGRSWRNSYDYKFEKDGFTGEPSGDVKYFVALKGYVNESIDSNDIQQLCKAYGVERHLVFGVAKRHTASLDSSWIDLIEHLKEKVNGTLDRYKLHGKQHCVMGRYTRFMSALEKHDDVSILRKATDKLALSGSEVNDLKFACRRLNIGMEFVTEMEQFDALVDAKETELGDKYPLLANVDSRNDDKKVIEHMVRYIDMVNQL